MRKTLLAAVLLVLFGNISKLQAQPGKESNPYILFTGLVLTSDSLQAIPYVTIKTRKRGMIGYTDVYGYFEVVVKKGDTIYFTQVEQIPSYSIVPDTLTASKYSVVKLMVQDTMSKEESRKRSDERRISTEAGRCQCKSAVFSPIACE